MNEIGRMDSIKWNQMDELEQDVYMIKYDMKKTMNAIIDYEMCMALNDFFIFKGVCWRWTLEGDRV